MVEYPKPWLLFWVAAIIAHFYMDYTFIRKWRSWNRGTAPSPDPEGQRGGAAGIWFAEVFLQRQLFALSPFRWLIHILIFYGFAGLLFISLFTFVLRALGYLGIDSGIARFFLSGGGHTLIKIAGDFFGLALLTGLVVAFLKRLFFRPAQQDNKQMDILLLLFLLWLTVSGFALETARVALTPGETARYSFFAHIIAPAGYAADQLRSWLTALWTVHAFSTVGFLVYLPHSKLMHSLLAPIVIARNTVEEQYREDMYWPNVKKYKATR
ncbi:MAG TPA: respiratory nitrate reductase subunit gamma [Dissulfurispiraceae bacterium]